jgi:hypothetical protein
MPDFAFHNSPDAMTAFKATWRPVIQEVLPLEGWMDEEDIATMVEMAIETVGGWQAFYGQVKKGLENGYTEEQQIKIVKELFRQTDN